MTMTVKEQQRSMDSALGWKVRYEREKKRADELEEILRRLTTQLSSIQDKVSRVEQESEELLHYLRTGDQGPALG